MSTDYYNKTIHKTTRYPHTTVNQRLVNLANNLKAKYQILNLKANPYLQIHRAQAHDQIVATKNLKAQGQRMVAQHLLKNHQLVQL